MRNRSIVAQNLFSCRYCVYLDLVDARLHSVEKLTAEMPTIIALDVSLSMTRTIPISANAANANGAGDCENVTYHQLAVQGINQFLNYLTANSKLEYVALVSRFCFVNSKEEVNSGLLTIFKIKIQLFG